MLVSLTQLQEEPSKNLIVLVEPPGFRKSMFCEQVILQSLDKDRPFIYMKTKYGSLKAKQVLMKKEMGAIKQNLLTFVDSYIETVGGYVIDRPQMAYVDCNNLMGIEIAISRLWDRIDTRGDVRDKSDR